MEIVDDLEKIIVEKDGKKVECDVLFTFDSPDTMKSYIGYTDNEVVNGEKSIYVTSFDPLSDPIVYEEIVDEREKEMVDDVINQIRRGK